MIKYNILEKLKEAGYSTTKLRSENLIGQGTLTRIRRGESVSTNVIDTACRLTGCKVEELIEYVEDAKNN